MAYKTAQKIADEYGFNVEDVKKAIEFLPGGSTSENFRQEITINEKNIGDLRRIIVGYDEMMAERKRKKEAAQKAESLAKNMLITSGYDVQGYRIVEYREFITAEAVFGMGMFKGIAASLSDVAGIESDSLNSKIQEARDTAMDRFKRKAGDLGCNAIIGADLDMTMFGETLLGVVINGTAVVIEKA